MPKIIFFFFTSLFLAQCFGELTNIHSFFAVGAITVLITAVICVMWYLLKKLKIKGKPLIEITERVESPGRKTGGDIIRAIAVLFVPSLHFFGLSGYYNTPLDDSMVFATALRWLTLCAVPLFMIITGYFKSGKKPDYKHYMAIFPLLLTHIVITGIRIFVDMKFHNIPIDFEYIKNKLLLFEYGWYIRLYIGMLLIMPFFNAAYHSLKNRKQKEIFVLTLCSLNFLGPLTDNIVPSTWLILYVFGYYGIGLFIREYKIYVNPILNILMIMFFIGITTAATHIHCGGGIFDWNYIGYQANSGYSCITSVIVSSLLMILCIDIDIKPVFALPFKLIGMVSLEMYLFSQMFDGFIYPHFAAKGYDFKMFFANFILVVPLSALLAFFASHITSFIVKIIKIPFAAVLSKFEEKAQISNKIVQDTVADKDNNTLFEETEYKTENEHKSNSLEEFESRIFSEIEKEKISERL